MAINMEFFKITNTRRTPLESGLPQRNDVLAAYLHQEGVGIFAAYLRKLRLGLLAGVGPGDEIFA